MECLITNEVCPKNNKKCKICKLSDCQNTFKIIEEAEKMWFKTEEQKFQEEIGKEYPECKGCSFLVKRNDNKVYCFYRVKERCILK
ncbi:MAG: hypothetical protein HFJ45_02525 [Clostridia bacterium]|nr:hypothetical protein [Clostridia bacterium]